MSNHINPYQVAAYECDQENRLSTATIFNWLQDSMDKFSQAHHVGYDFCQSHGLTYMLKAYDVKLNQLPTRNDSVQMDTQLCAFGPGSLFFTQDLYDQDHKKLLLSAVSHVVLIDLIKKRPTRVKDYMPLHLLDGLAQTPAFTPLPPLDHAHTTRIQEITPDYIDFNQHVNNTHYITFAERALDPVFLKKARLERIRAAYKQSATMGDTLQVDTKIAPGFTDHQISSATTPNTIFARVRLSWAQRNK